MKVLENIFSVKNEVCRKVITILGIKIKFFSSRLCMKEVEKLQKQLHPALLYTKYSKWQINKGMIDIQIRKFKNRKMIGINQEEKRNPKIIVSLTTFPERISYAHYAIFSLLNQTVKPDKVVLWLAEEQFPDREEDISQDVLDLQEHGLEIRYTKDIKSHKKLIPALKEFPDDIIVTADDDLYYQENWLEKLYSEYLQNPELIYAHRVFRASIGKNNVLKPYKKWGKCLDDESISFLNHPTTGGGVLYPPHSLYKDITNEELFMKLTPTCDETWNWAMTVLNGTKVKVIKNPITSLALVDAERESLFGKETTLRRENWDNNQKEVQIKNVLDHYPQILDTLKKEMKNKK